MELPSTINRSIDLLPRIAKLLTFTTPRLFGMYRETYQTSIFAARKLQIICKDLDRARLINGSYAKSMLQATIAAIISWHDAHLR